MSTILVHTDVCDKQYICASVVYHMSVMPQCYSVIIDQGWSAPGHGKEVVDGINPVDQRYIYQLMSTVKFTGSNIFGSHIQMHTGNHNNGLSLAK